MRVVLQEVGVRIPDSGMDTDAGFWTHVQHETLDVATCLPVGSETKNEIELFE